MYLEVIFNLVHELLAWNLYYACLFAVIMQIHSLYKYSLYKPIM